MVPLMKEACIDKRNWITEKEFLDVFVVAESTPGPIAINMATYVGYKRAGILGAIVATLGVVITPISIIYLISLFFSDMLKIEIVNNAFIGIRIGVSLIIVEVALNMIRNEIKHTEHKKLSIFLFLTVFLILLIAEIIGRTINTIYIIIAAIILGIIIIITRKNI